MANKLYEESNIQAIANAIRAKGQTGTMTVAQMPSKIAGIKTKSTYTWNQCPTAVKEYLDNVTYNPNDYTTSQIADYAPAVAVQSNTKPIGKTLDGVTYYNEVPNVTTPFSSTSEAGTLKPLDRLRWINSQTPNMRDLGGWSCDGGTVKYGKLFRGSEPLAGDKALALSLGIRHELNLRGNEIPIRNYSIWDIPYTQFEHYAWNLNNDAVWGDIIKAVFYAVNHNIPLYFHCAAGADRTGATALLIEAILGMSQSDMDKDYELTCFYSGTGTDANARRRNETDWTTNINFINSQSGDTFRDRAISFVLSHGITYDEINAFRANLIDGNPELINPPAPSPNLVDTIGYAENTRVSMSDGTNRTGVAGFASFGSTKAAGKYIEVDAGDVIRIKGITFPAADDSKSGIFAMNMDGTILTSNYLSHTHDHVGSYITSITYDGDLTTLTVNAEQPTPFMFRICGPCADPANAIIKINEEINPVPTYTNQIPISTDTDGSIYNSIGYKLSTRINSSANTVEFTNISAIGATGFIPVKKGDIIRLKNCKIYSTHANASSFNVCQYDANKTKLSSGGTTAWTQFTAAHASSFSYWWKDMQFDDNGYVTQFELINDNVKYIRFTLLDIGPNSVITVNEVIV